MGFIKFLFSRTFIKHFAISLAVILVLLISVFVWLNFYTNHGKSIIVPDLIGLNEAQVNRLINNTHLRFEIIDSIHTSDVPMGTVYEQIPAAGSKVKKQRKIFIILNAKNKRMVAMPDLQDLSVRQATTVLQSAKLNLSNIIYVPSEFKNVVIGQLHDGKEIEPGAKIQEGSDVVIMVANGLSSETTLVPDLKGYLVKDAQNILTGIGLNIGTKVLDSHLPDTINSDSLFIYNQKPEGQSRLHIGANITLWITNDSLRLQADTTTTILN